MSERSATQDGGAQETDRHAEWLWDPETRFILFRGERALLEGGTRTSTLRASTPITVAVATAPDIQPSVLEELASGHRREESAI